MVLLALGQHERMNNKTTTQSLTIVTRACDNRTDITMSVSLHKHHAKHTFHILGWASQTSSSHELSSYTHAALRVYTVSWLKQKSDKHILFRQKWTAPFLDIRPLSVYTPKRRYWMFTCTQRYTMRRDYLHHTPRLATPCAERLATLCAETGERWLSPSCAVECRRSPCASRTFCTSISCR